MNSQGYNIVGSTAGSTGFGGLDQQNVDPLLDALALNGGTTRTHALLAGSTAIDGADPACGLTVDQRGLPRPTDGDGDAGDRCDVGAFEAPALPPTDPCPPCVADFNGDDGVDDLDIVAFFTAFENGDECADVNNDDGIDDLDIVTFFTAFESGC